MSTHITFCRVRSMLCTKTEPPSNVIVSHEMPKTHAYDFARRQMTTPNPAFKIGTIIDVVCPIEYVGGKITRYLIIDRWRKISDDKWEHCKIPEALYTKGVKGGPEDIDKVRTQLMPPCKLVYNGKLVGTFIPADDSAYDALSLFDVVLKEFVRCRNSKGAAHYALDFNEAQSTYTLDIIPYGSEAVTVNGEPTE